MITFSVVLGNFLGRDRFHILLYNAWARKRVWKRRVSPQKVRPTVGLNVVGEITPMGAFWSLSTSALEHPKDNCFQ